MTDVWNSLAAAIEDRHGLLRRPCFVGLCGPQGSGKSTGAAKLSGLLHSRGLRTAVVSLDDFYLTLAERHRLADNVHPLLITRGPPGTHDLSLGVGTTRRLLAGQSFAIPSFAKHLDDRAAMQEWPIFAGPADIVILEGWCVGARPQPDEALVNPINDLERLSDEDGTWRRFVNTALKEYQSWFAELDYLIQLRPPSFDVVATWRLEQENSLRSRLGAERAAKLMDAEKVAEFVAYYERLTRALISEGGSGADAIIDLDHHRGANAVKFHTRDDIGRAIEPGSEKRSPAVTAEIRRS